MLEEAEIKFSQMAAKVAERYLRSKKAYEFLMVLDEKTRIKRKEEKKEARKEKGDERVNPSKFKEFYGLLLGKKQKSKTKVYTTDIEKTKNLLLESIIKDCRLNAIFSQKLFSVLYISMSETSYFDNMRLPDHMWPMVYLNDDIPECVINFKKELNDPTTIDFMDLILKINE